MELLETGFGVWKFRSYYTALGPTQLLHPILCYVVISDELKNKKKGAHLFSCSKDNHSHFLQLSWNVME